MDGGEMRIPHCSQPPITFFKSGAIERLDEDRREAGDGVRERRLDSPRR
jgi:hypothetical protein